VIEELIRLAKDLRDAGKRGEGLRLNDDEFPADDCRNGYIGLLRRPLFTAMELAVPEGLASLATLF